MSWTKRDLIQEAFAELGLAEYVFDLTAPEYQTALRRLDVMMAMWEGKGVRVAYSFPSSADGSNLEEESGLPDKAVDPVILNLAVRIAPGFGKQVSLETKKNARDGYDTLLWGAAQPIEQQFPSTLPRGAGNRIWRNSQRPFFPAPDDDPLGLSQGGDLVVLPE